MSKNKNNKKENYLSSAISFQSSSDRCPYFQPEKIESEHSNSNSSSHSSSHHESDQQEDVKSFKKELYMAMCQIKEKFIKHRTIYTICQKDFQHGTLIIDKPGIWQLTEDIILDFNPDNDYWPLNNKKKSFSLGFFAGIMIVGCDILLDLNGHTIAQSETFALQQRFFAIIELSSAPFMPHHGPGDFGRSIISSNFVAIYNGTLGRSAHHGIHGNNATNIIIENLKIKDFEVAGLAFNGGKNYIIKNVKIGPNCQQVPVNGKYNAARLLKFFYQSCYDKVDQKDKIKMKRVVGKLNKIVHSVYEDVEQGRPVACKLFRNKNGLPDTVSYGLVCHPMGVAVGDFNNGPASDCVDNVYLSKIKISNIVSSFVEVVGVSCPETEHNKTYHSQTVQVDPSGSVLPILKITDKDGHYKRNPLSNAQLLLAKMSHKYNFTVGKMNISLETVKWAAHGEPYKAEHVYGGDIMHHFAKPTQGFRIDGVNGLLLKKCQAKQIKSLGYGHRLHAGYSVMGFNLAFVRNAILTELKNLDICSRAGDAIGYRFMNNCHNVSMTCFTAKGIRAGIDENCSVVTNAVGVQVLSEDCQVELKAGCVTGLEARGCTVPIWLTTI